MPGSEAFVSQFRQYDHKLLAHYNPYCVIQNTSEGTCAFACIESPTCKSYNFYATPKLAGEFRPEFLTCELFEVQANEHCGSVDSKLLQNGEIIYNREKSIHPQVRLNCPEVDRTKLVGE